jgi:arylformamidase
VEIFDISQTLVEGMAVWPGDPEFVLHPVLKIAEGEVANVSEIRLGTHAGTHIDAPFHLDDSGKDATSIALSSLVGPARVIRFSGETCIRADDLYPLDWQGVERVLFCTRSGSKPESSFDSNFIYFAEDAAQFLAGKGIQLVGTDAPSIDTLNSTGLPAHKALFGAGIVILENARLDGVLPGDYNLVCLPLKLAGADGSPARAILWR